MIYLCRFIQEKETLAQQIYMNQKRYHYSFGISRHLKYTKIIHSLEKTGSNIKHMQKNVEKYENE